MAAPTLFAAGALFAAASGTSITPVIPDGDAADDIGVMECMCNGASTFSTPAGWTILGTAVNSANESAAFFWKRLTGSDGDPTSTTSAIGSTTVGLYGRIYVFRGCIPTGNPFEAVANAGAPTSSTTPVTSQVITTDVERLVCSLVLADDDNTWASGMPPANWANMGGRLVSTVGGDCMSDAISRIVPTATTIAAATIGTMSAIDFWYTLSFALIPNPVAPVEGIGSASIFVTAKGIGASTLESATRAPIPAVLMVNDPTAWNVHPYYKVPITPGNWGNATDLALIDAALAAGYPNRTRTVLIAEDDGTANGRCVTALNWALRHYDEVQAIALRSPIIDLQERHDRVGGAEATSIEAAYGGSGSRLSLPGSAGAGADTPDAAALDITSDIDIRLELQLADWTAPFFWTVMSKWIETGNQRSWRLLLKDNGVLEFGWSTTGTDNVFAASTVSPSTVLGPNLGAIRVTLDVVDGANKTVTFYTSDTIGGSWTILGSAVTTAGNTSIFASTSEVEIGTINNGAGAAFFDPLVGLVSKMEIRNGIGGTVVANPDFSAQTPGATSFADGTGKTWTINPAAEITAGYIGQMSVWNPAFVHRKGMSAQLFADRCHIWRDSADSVTPIAVTDAIAAAMRATLHTTVGTPATIVPTGQDWVQQPAWVEMKKLHDYARTSPANSAWKSGDGGRTVLLPDGRWFSYFADSFTGAIDPDETFTNVFGVVRNAVILHDSEGNITGQHYSGAPGTPAFVPDQIEFPNSFYWPVGGDMEGGFVRMVVDHREGGGFGTGIDLALLTLDPDTFAEISYTSLGVPQMLLQNIIPDPNTGFVYCTIANPTRLARVPFGQMTDINAWTYWDGTGWNIDRLSGAQLLEIVPGGGTRPLRVNEVNDGWDLRRYKTGWLAVIRGWWEPYVGIYYSTQPQGPWTFYSNVPTPETGGLRWGATLYAYTPFWHPERDPAADRLVMSYNALTLGETDVPTTDQDFYYYDTHFLVVPMHRDPFGS